MTLVDPDRIQPDPAVAAIYETLAQLGRRGTREQHLGTGLFQVGHWNFGNSLDEAAWKKYSDFDNADWNSYGVCDSPEQFLRHPLGRFVVESPRLFCVSFVRLQKKDEPPKGGWRWHKWGPYIGEQSPQHEYLAHEPVIEEVWTYSIYEQGAAP